MTGEVFRLARMCLCRSDNRDAAILPDVVGDLDAS
jgi:hypothetical protein